MSKEKLIELLKAGNKPKIIRENDGSFKEFVIEEISKLNEISHELVKNKQLISNEVVNNLKNEILKLEQNFSANNSNNVYKDINSNISLLEQNFLVKINLLKKVHRNLVEKISLIENNVIEFKSENLIALKTEFETLNNELTQKFENFDKNLFNTEDKVLAVLKENFDFIVSNLNKSNKIVDSNFEFLNETKIDTDKNISKITDLVIQNKEELESRIIENENAIIDFSKEILKQKKESEDAIIDFSKEILKQKKENAVNEVFNAVLEKNKENDDAIIEFSKEIFNRNLENSKKIVECENVILQLTEYVKAKFQSEDNNQDTIKKLDEFFVILNKNSESVNQINSIIEDNEKTLQNEIKTVFESFDKFDNKIIDVEKNIFTFVNENLQTKDDFLLKGFINFDDKFTQKCTELEDKINESLQSKNRQSLIFEDEIKALRNKNTEIVEEFDLFKTKLDKFTDSLLEKISVHKKLTSDSITNIFTASFSDIENKFLLFKESYRKEQLAMNDNILSIKNIIAEQKSEIFIELIAEIKKQTNGFLLKEDIEKIVNKIIVENKPLTEKAEVFNLEIKTEDIKKVFNDNPELFEQISNIPDHQYKDGHLRFKKPNGEWGEPIRLYNMAQYYGGGGGNVINQGGSLNIYDEGVLIKKNVSDIDFIGSSVVAVSENGKVKIFVPPPNYVSNFNAQNGSTNATLANTTTTLRYVSKSNGNSLFETGNWDLANTYPCLNNNTIVYSTADYFSLKNSNTTFEVLVLSPTKTIYSKIITLNNNYNNTNDGVKIEVTNYQADSNQFKCKITITFYLDILLPIGGRVNLKMIHHNLENDFEKSQEFFYDKQINSIDFNNISIDENIPNKNYLSGIQYYGTNSSFTFNIADLDNLNDKSYPLNQVEVDGAEFGLSLLNLTKANLTNWTNDWDNKNASYTNNNYLLNRSNYFYLGNAVCKVRVNDWVYSAYKNSNTQSIAVNTLVDNSTRIYENFITESYRLKSDLISPWVSTEDLHFADNGNGLQIKNSFLVYPCLNFKTYKPGLTNNFDYSDLIGEKVYYRKFWHTSTTYSNGELTLTGNNLTESNFGTNFKIEWTVDKVNWFSLNSNYEGGALLPNAGSRINKDSVNLSNGKLAFTMGENLFSKEIYFKIILINNIVEINSIGINWI